MTRTIRVSSTALGPRETVTVIVYPNTESLIAAADAYNGADHEGCFGVTQAQVDDNGRATRVIVRLSAQHLSVTVVSHELHHAATAIYGAHAANRVSRAAHLTHHNEPFAYLFSDLLGCLVSRLYALGYYPPANDDGRPVPCGHDTAGGALRDAHLAAHPQDESLF